MVGIFHGELLVIARGYTDIHRCGAMVHGCGSDRTGRRWCCWLERPISVYNISVKLNRFPHLGMVVFEHKSYLPIHMHHIHPYPLFASAFEKQSESYQ